MVLELASTAQRDRIAPAKRGSGRHGAERGGDGELGERGLLVGQSGVGGDDARAAPVVVGDDALASQERDDARTRDLQEVGDVVVGETGKRVERQLAGIVLGEHAIERERVEVGIQAQVTRDALHGGDGAALAAVDAASAQAASVPGEQRVSPAMAGPRGSPQP